MLIGIIGKKMHGKDTIADILVRDFDFKKYSFADPLKIACQIIFDLSHAQVYGNQKEVVDERWNLTPREILQFVGTELFRERLPQISEKFRNKIGSDIWVKLFEFQYSDLIDNIVVPDVRFKNEIDLIKKLGGVIIKVIRPLPDSGDQHKSELEWQNETPNVIILNNKGIEELNCTVHSVYNTIKG